MIDRERLDDRLEKGILGLITLILVLGPLLFGSVRVRDELILSGLTVAALGLWLVRFWIRSDYRILWPPFAWTVLAFVVYAIWRYKAADVEYIARLDLNRIILYTAIFFLVLDNLNRQEWTQFLVFVVIGVGTVMSMYAIYQYLTGSKWIYNTPQPVIYHGRAGGPFVCPNHLAGYLAMTLPLAFSMTLMARFKPLTKVFLGYAGIVMLCGLICTVSRGGIAAAVLGLLSLFAVMVFRRDTRLPAIVAIALILIPAVWLGLNSFRLQERFKKGAAAPSTAYAGDRSHLYRVAKTVWLENFWTGVGAAHFNERFRWHRPALAQLQVQPNRVHNDYLNVLADYGFIGFSLIATAWGVFWLGVVRIWRFVRRANDFGSKQSTRAAVVLGGSAGMIALMAHSFVDFDMHIPALAILVVTLLAVVTGHWRFATERLWVRPGIPGRLLASMLCLAAMGWMGFQIARLWPEQMSLMKVTRRVIGTPRELELLKAAAAAEPNNAQTAYLVGDAIRKQAWAGAPGYEKQTEEALGWFEKTIALNKYEPHGFIGKGLCLDWLGRTKEGWPYFREALRLDPNSYYVRAHFGWHLYQLGNNDRALLWFMRSQFVRPNNPIAKPYVEIIRRRQAAEKAAREKGQPVIP